jgi:hypothetical protein
MSSLTFDSDDDNNVPVAQILEIEDNKVVEEHPIFLSPEEPSQVDSFLSQRLTPATIEALTRKFKSGVTFNDVVSSFATPKSHNREIKTEPGDVMQFLPSYPGTERVFVAGRSRSGKSTIIADYAVNYINIYPDRRIIMFCRVAGDPAYKILENFDFSE